MAKEALARTSHLLVVLPKSKALPDDLPGKATLSALLSRRKMKPAELGNTPVSAELGQGGIAAWVMVNDDQSIFELHSTIRKALQLLLPEQPRALDVVVMGSDVQRLRAGEAALYAALVNGVSLPTHKPKNVN
jgi:leucyl aminopeptidase